jgi:mannosyltransferase OCH1-like enzyme
VIPARIIQTAKRRELPLKQRAFVTNVRLLNPDYEWRFFDDRDVDAFVSAEFPQFKSIFDSFPFLIQRFDFFRYLAVYRLGGFYFDLDVLLANELSPLRSTEAVFPFEGLGFSRLLRSKGMDWEIGNYAFGAAAGHPFLEAVIDNCVRAQREPRWVEEMMPGVPVLSRSAHKVLYSTGPGLISRTLAENPSLAARVTVLFPADVCDSSSWNRFGDFGVHLMEGSWRPQMSYLRKRLTLRREASAAKKLQAESRRFGKTRTAILARG